MQGLLRCSVHIIVADNRENFNDYIHKYPGKYVSHGSALHAKMERGDSIGNDAPYGYQKDPNNKNRLLINQETAPIVRMIFRWRAGGLSDMGINKHLNDMAIPSPSQQQANSAEGAKKFETEAKDSKMLLRSYGRNFAAENYFFA